MTKKEVGKRLKKRLSTESPRMTEDAQKQAQIVIKVLNGWSKDPSVKLTSNGKVFFSECASYFSCDPKLVKALKSV